MKRHLQHAPFAIFLGLLLVAICLSGVIATAETGFLVVHVEDVQGHPLSGVQIGVKGDGGSGISDPRGTIRIRLGQQTQVKDWVTLQVLHSPAGKDLVLLSPWDARAVVPSFENKPDNFVDVVVVESGDRTALLTPTALRALTAKINKASAGNPANKPTAKDPKANLDAVAKQYGLSSEDLDKAIRAWGVQATDPYDVGLAALYARNYGAATTSLQESLKQREEKLVADKKADEKAVADAACFLGQSLYPQGKYRESAAAYQRCLQIWPDNSSVLNNTALSLFKAGDPDEAELLYRRAIALDNKTLSPNDPERAWALNNLGLLLKRKGDYEHAEPLYQQAIGIREKALGPEDPALAQSLNNLGMLFLAEGKADQAEPLLLRALNIREKVLPPDDPDLAESFNNVALVLEGKGEIAAAEALYRKALAIDERSWGPDHPDLAIDLNNLGLLLEDKKEFAEAEPMLRRAAAIDEKTLGPNHPTTQEYEQDLKECLQKAAQAGAGATKN